jgi:hypothetical protein
MPAFGLNQYAIPYVWQLYESFSSSLDGDGNPVLTPRGFRPSDRQLTAINEFIGGVIPRLSATTNKNYITGPTYGWGRWLFLYLFIGGQEWSHSIDLTGNYSAPVWSGTITHNQNGFTCGAGGRFDTQCDAADVTNNPQAWNRRAQGFYSRTNNAVSERNLSAQIVYTPNGYTYWQGITPRHTDGNFYSDLVSNTNAAVPATNLNRVTVAITSSAGFSAQSRTTATDHRAYRAGAQIGVTDTATEIGMGGANHMTTASRFLSLSSGSRNFCFLFSTKHTHALTVTEMAYFNFYVQRLQKGLQREV